MTALDMRNHLVSLHAERALALTANPSLAEEDLSEIDREIEFTRVAYTGFAVTEIATLRGELFGRQAG
jgi:hypothetical protein